MEDNIKMDLKLTGEVLDWPNLSRLLSSENSCEEGNEPMAP
jgi:hypothetical protein